MSFQSKSQKKYLEIFVIVLTMLSAILYSLLKNWEMSESLRSWFFARVFAETGKFIVLDRSPLYVLYLNLFLWMGYPISVVVEHIVTSLIVVLALIYLFKRYFGIILATFVSLLWIPFLTKYSEPSVQILALAFSLFGVAVRLKEPNKSKKAISYAFFILAYLFRPSYLPTLIVFALWDLIQLFKQKNFKKIILSVKPNLYCIPLFIILSLIFLFAIMQSPHHFNNVYGTSTDWFPNEAKSQAQAGIIGLYNWKYIGVTYGSFKDKDFYFTNKEDFNDAKTTFEFIAANPKFIFEQLLRNIKDTVINFAWMTELIIISRILFSSNPVFPLIISSIAAFFIIFGALKMSKYKSMALFIISLILQIGVITIFTPGSRYMAPLIPALVLSGFWFGLLMRDFLAKVSIKLKSQKMLNISVLKKIALPFAFILFSNGIVLWGFVTLDAANSIYQNDAHILEQRPYSMKASFSALNPLVQDCNGVLSLEHQFIGAFMDISLDKVYDVFEIPPFGHFGDPIYNGLRPDRIDCVLVSHELATGVGFATNYQIRYDNYIQPYVEELQEIGAITYDIPTFGKAIILPKSE